LRLSFRPLACTSCGLCEMACSLRRDGVLTPMSSSIILHSEDKANYFGLVLKSESEGVVLVRPEGVASGQESSGSGGPGAKPILLREPCDLCGGDPMCVKACPVGCISLED
jgi:carbon-monoxide dehydrogenase iron sulfur subunit